MEHVELKIIATSLILQELLDETLGKSKYKHKIRWHCKALTKHLEQLTDQDLTDDDLSLLVTNAMNALENSLDDVLKEII